MPSPHPRIDDLDRLFRSLRDAGFAVGVEQSLRIETVLRVLGAAPQSADVALSEVVAAIILTDQEHRPELDRVVELWMQSLGPLQTDSPETADLRPPLSDSSSAKRVELRRTEQRNRRRVDWGIGILGILLGMALAVWFALSRHGLPDLPDAALITTNEPADLRPPNPDLSVPAPDLGVRTEKPATHRVWVPTLTKQPRELPSVVWVWAGVAALSALLGMGLWLALRNRSYLPTLLPLPTRPGLPRIVPSAEANHRNQSFLLSRRDEDSAVWGIGQFISTEKTRRLDIPRTVSATADAAGQPRLHFVPARHAREVWLWLDESMGLRGDGSGDDTRRFVAELANVLTLAGLPVEQARFWGLPEELSSDYGTFSPSEVDERRDAALVLIFTDGELLRGSLDSATDRPRVESLLRQLGHWPQLAFVDSTQGAACLPALLQKYELLALLPEQVPAFLAGQSAPTALPLRGLAGPMLIGEERAWAAALALSPTPVDDQTAHLLREHLRLAVSPWRIGVLRSQAELEAGGLLFGTPERARLLSWLLAVAGGSTGRDTWIGQALSFYRHLLDSEDQRRLQREPAEPWLSTPSEHHLRMQQALLLLWDDPERAAEQLFRRYRDPLAAEIRRHLAWLGPTECAGEVEHGLTVLPWAMKDRTPRARLLLRELGLGSASLGWKPRAESLRRPGRLPLGLGLCAGLSLLGLLGVFQSLPRHQGEPTVDNPSPPPGAVVKIKPLGVEQYEVLAHSGSEQAQLTVSGGSLVHLAWDSHQEPDPTDAGTLADFGADLSTPPDLSEPEDIAQREDLPKPKERPDLAKPPRPLSDMTVHQAAQKIADRRITAKKLANLGNVAQSQGDYAAARKYYQGSLELTEALGDRIAIASNLSALGNVAQSQGDYAAARKYYQGSLELTEALGDRIAIANNLSALGNVAQSQGDYAAARKYYQGSLELTEALGDRIAIANNLSALGNVAQSQGDYAAARKYYQQSLDLAQALGDRKVIAKVLWGQAWVAAKKGRKAEARLLLDQAIQIFAMLGDPALAGAQKERAALGDSPDPLQCRKTCDELQAKGELAVPVAECVQKLCAD